MRSQQPVRPGARGADDSAPVLADHQQQNVIARNEGAGIARKQVCSWLRPVVCVAAFSWARARPLLPALAPSLLCWVPTLGTEAGDVRSTSVYLSASAAARWSSSTDLEGSPTKTHLQRLQCAMQAGFE